MTLRQYIVTGRDHDHLIELTDLTITGHDVHLCPANITPGKSKRLVFLPFYGTNDQPCWLAEACQILLLPPPPYGT